MKKLSETVSKFSNQIVKPLVNTLHSTLEQLERSAAERASEEEVTHKTSATGTLEASKGDVDWLMSLLEPHFFHHVLPKLKHKRVLYVFFREARYLSSIVEKEPERIFCLGPQLPPKLPETGQTPFHFIVGEFFESCLAPHSFDVLILPETSCKGLHFLTRTSYWASLLKKNGEIVLAMPHPLLRFLMRGQGRRRTSRTATFERLFERSKESGLEIVDLREITLSQIPAAVLKKNPTWQRLCEDYDEVPGLIGLYLRKKEDPDHAPHR